MPLLNMGNKNIFIVGFIVGMTTGFIGGRFYPINDVSIGGAGVAELEQKIEDAKKFFPSIADMRSVSGTIETIRGNSLFIKISSSPNPLEDLPGKIEVSITISTKIVRLIQKDQEEFRKELEASQEQVKPGEPFHSPMPFVEKVISLNDIKVGDQVVIEVGENIKGKTKLEAVRIIVQTHF